MNPQPLIGILADHGFQQRVYALRVRLNVAGHLDRRIEAQDVALLGFRPQRESRNHGRSAVMRELDEGGAGAGLVPEEIDEHALVERGVLVDQNADGLARRQRPQNFARGFFLLDDVIAGKRAALLDQASMRGLSSGRTTMCIGAVISAWANALSSQLPRCAGRDQHAFARAPAPL